LLLYSNTSASSCTLKMYRLEPGKKFFNIIVQMD
jgi:hypothetical protein